VPRVLIIEDERKVLRSLERGLSAEGYEVVTASTGEAGYDLALSQEFDCLILDLMLPGRGGLEILGDLRRAARNVPVLILTARDAIEDRVSGLDAGSDDYLVKPFAFAELLARLRVLFRRGRPDRETVLRASDVEMDLLRRRVTRGGNELSLTIREFELLEYLLRHKNETVTREMLGRDVWKEPAYALTNVIDVYIKSVRRKLELPDQPNLIQTHRGLGYCLKEFGPGGP
jgi:two-component system, OmpR family, copper resistance phosphate regulon response regulator CusR